MRKNNKGLTLVELVVTIAIIAIFSGVVLTLISNGANSYRSTSSNAQVQRESQETLDQIQDLVIDANRSVYYTYSDDEEVGSIVWNDVDNDSGSNAMTKTFLICNVKEISNTLNEFVYDILQWDATSHKLYYSQKKYTKQEESEPENSLETSMMISDEKVHTENFDEGLEEKSTSVSVKTSDVETLIGRSELASDLINFCVDIRKVESERIVRFLITTKVSNKEIKTIHTVKLRNQIQVAAPDKAFGEAESKSGSIKIINAPKELNAGETRVLDKLLIGNVDPTSVRWEVLDSGSATGTFAKEDPTYGKLTVDKNQSGYITVRVSAQTTTGETVDDEVEIKIVDVRVPVQMVSDVQSVLFGMGNEMSYDLNNYVKWYETYSDGERVSDIPIQGIRWSCSGNGISVSESGRVVINDDAGTEPGNSVFNVYASYNSGEKTYNGQIIVSLACLVLSKPNGTYRVSDQKELIYSYYEGGVEVACGEPQISVIQKPQEECSYVVNSEFITSDIGNWKIKSSVELSGVGQYDIWAGIATSESEFKVVDFVEEREIVYEGDSEVNVVVAGEKYTYHYGNYNWGFGFHIPLYNMYRYKTKWEIEGNTDNNTRLNSSTVEGWNSGEMQVGNNEQGFILSAHTTIYEGNTNKIYKEYRGKIYLKVCGKIEITSPGNEVIKGETYDLGARLPISGISGVNAEGEYEHETEYYKCKKGELQWDSTAGGGFDGANWKWTVSMSQSQTATINVQNLGENFPNVAMHGITMKNTKNISVGSNPLIKQIVSEKTSLYLNEQLELWLKLENVKGNITNAQVTWESTGGSISSTYHSKAGEDYKVTFSANRPETYIIKAKYQIIDSNDSGEVELELTVTGN